MLLFLAEFLQQYYSGFSVFQYLTLRGILGVLTALAIALPTDLSARIARNTQLVIQAHA